MLDYTDITEPRAIIPTLNESPLVKRAYTPIYLGLLCQNGSFRVYAGAADQKRAGEAISTIWGASASVRTTPTYLSVQIPVQGATVARDQLRRKIYLQ